MLDRVQPPGRQRAAAALAVAAMLLGLAASAHAGPYECRAQIGKEAKVLLGLGSRFVDLCHKKRDRVCPTGSMRGECNIVDSANVDPQGKYASREAKALASIGAACTGSPVLANYPDGVQVDVLDKIVEELTGNSQLELGDEDLLCNKGVVACHRAIAQARSTVIKEVISDSVKCQRDLDKNASTFGTISPACLDSGSRTAAGARSKVTRNCTGVALNAVGSCSNTLASLDDCVVDSAIATGQDLAKAVYGAPVGCGDGTVGAGEQCDDSNTLSGDGCSASCELEGNTCTPYAGPGGGTGTRVVKVAIQSPSPVAGLQVTLDYPQFEAGLPGVGSSSIVQSRFQALQAASLAGVNDDNNATAVIGMVNVVDPFNSGDLFQITFDNCVALSQNICNRNQQVFGCGGLCLPGGTVCFNDGQCGGGAVCDFGNQVVCNPATNLPFGPGPQAGCCPADNACFSQVQATGCAVSDPVDEFGQSIAGVTCSVTVIEQP
jgi:cysteine-rich repeat protein